MVHLSGRLSRQLALGVGLLSFVLSLSVGVVSVSGHTPFRADRHALAELVSSQVGNPTDTWQAVHILAPQNCDCSRRVAEYLIGRGAQPALREYVLLIGKDALLSRRLNEAGFQTAQASEKEVAHRYKLHGVPWLILQQPGGAIRYAGGYSAERVLQPAYQDLTLWRTLLSGHDAKVLPAYGCALSSALQRRLDPFRWKYQNPQEQVQ